MSTTIQEAYSDLVEAVRSLGAVLRPAVDARYEAPPGVGGASADAASHGIPNPTLAIVIDPRRAALSDEIACVVSDLQPMTQRIRNRTENVSRALASWEGQDTAP